MISTNFPDDYQDNSHGKIMSNHLNQKNSIAKYGVLRNFGFENDSE